LSWKQTSLTVCKENEEKKMEGEEGCRRFNLFSLSGEQIEIVFEIVSLLVVLKSNTW